MKKIISVIVVVLLLLLGLFMYCNSRGTNPEIKKTVDLQYHKLSIKIVELETPDETNFESVAAKLDSIRWEPVEDGGSYEKAKKELYLEEKKKHAEEIKKFYDGSGNKMIPHIIEYPDDIKE